MLLLTPAAAPTGSSSNLRRPSLKVDLTAPTMPQQHHQSRGAAADATLGQASQSLFEQVRAEGYLWVRACLIMGLRRARNA